MRRELQIWPFFFIIIPDRGPQTRDLAQAARPHGQQRRSQTPPGTTALGPLRKQRTARPRSARPRSARAPPATHPMTNAPIRFYSALHMHLPHMPRLPHKAHFFHLQRFDNAKSRTNPGRVRKHISHNRTKNTSDITNPHCTRTKNVKPRRRT